MKKQQKGILEWHSVEDLHHLPMAEGDRTNLLFAVQEKGMQYGTFVYTPEFCLNKGNDSAINGGRMNNG